MFAHLEVFERGFCAFVIEYRIEWPSRLNLQMSIHGLGVLDIEAVAKLVER